MKPKDALRKAANILGGQSAVAKLLGYDDRRNVWHWFNTDSPIKVEHCLLIEEATRKAGRPVTCEQLRPDVRWDVVRNREALPSDRRPKVA